MIQRIQSLFMFLSAILSGLLFFFPLAAFDYGNVTMNLSVLGINNQIDATYFSSTYTWPLIVLTVLMIIIPIFTAFLYKRRQQQVKLCQLDMFLTAVFIGLVLLYYVSDVQTTIASESVSYKFGVIIPLVILVLDVLAIRGVKKDIELLKSVDRLRSKI